MPESVSRETSAPPPGAEAVFPRTWPEVLRYVDLLATDGVERGLLGPREVSRLWDRHILNCAAIAPAFIQARTLCDVGSGAGLPGIVLALALPDVEVTLLEPLLRRSIFLEEAVGVLGLENVSVVRGRAEEQPRGDFDAVTARAVAPLEKLVRWCLPLCSPGGRFVAMKGDSAEQELAATVPALKRVGARSWRVRHFELSTTGSRAVAVEVIAEETRASNRRRRS